MDIRLARKLVPLVNALDEMDLIHTYVEDRLRKLHKDLETAIHIDKVKELQGAIRELRRFETLRDEVIEGSKEPKV